METPKREIRAVVSNLDLWHSRMVCPRCCSCTRVAASFSLSTYTIYINLALSRDQGEEGRGNRNREREREREWVRGQPDLAGSAPSSWTPNYFFFFLYLLYSFNFNPIPKTFDHPGENLALRCIHQMQKKLQHCPHSMHFVTSNYLLLR